MVPAGWASYFLFCLQKLKHDILPNLTKSNNFFASFFLLKLTGALIGFNTWKVSLGYLINILLKRRVSFSLLRQYLLCFRILLCSFS